MKRVLLTGATGFLGRHILRTLLRAGMKVLAPGRKVTVEYLGDFNYKQRAPVDLEEGMTKLDRAMRKFQPDAVIHSAAYYGGLGICMKERWNLFSRNLTMAINVLGACVVSETLTRFLSVGSACGYPGSKRGKIAETQWWDGPLHPSVEPYGFTKKAQEVGARILEADRGVQPQIAILTNLYGPGDVFQEYRSHVIAALIKKFADAKVAGEPEVVCWGTGHPTREFLHVEDAAEGIVALLQSDLRGLCNIGTGIETSIKDLAEMIKREVDYRGEIVWDKTKSDGTARKVLDVTRAKKQMGWNARIPLAKGLHDTVLWYMANKKEADKRP